ncbi:hypothetical protein GGI35DRAFT_442819 [Trichoderma velutinum]
MAPVPHLIYAGHGDTFILEYEVNTVKELVIVDGGPRKRSGEVLRAGAYAPYPKYLVSAAKAIWQASRGADIPFAPDAIFNSHPDSDHYKGLLELLKSSLQDGNAAPNTDAMVFNGPFLVPVMFDRNGNKANQHALNAVGRLKIF